MPIIRLRKLLFIPSLLKVGLSRWPSNNLPVNAGDAVSIPGLGRYPGGGNGNTLQCYCLKIPMDRGPSLPQSMGCKELDMTEQLSMSTSMLKVSSGIDTGFHQILFLHPLRKSYIICLLSLLT